MPVPSTYEEFVNGFGHKVRRYIAGYGIVGDDAEELEQIMYTDFYIGGYLEAFNPTICPFEGFFYAFMKTRMKAACRERARKRQKFLTLDGLDESGPYFAPPISFDHIGNNEILLEIERRLSLYPVHGTRDLVKIFRDLMMQIILTSEINQSDLARRYGISASAMSGHVAALRRALKESCWDLCLEILL